ISPRRRRGSIDHPGTDKYLGIGAWALIGHCRLVVGHSPSFPMPSTANLHRHPDPHVLIVEDEQRLRDLLLRSIVNWGFDASAARSAEEAMRHTDAAPPDIVLLDLNLPGVDGLDFFTSLRRKRPEVQGLVLT